MSTNVNFINNLRTPPRSSFKLLMGGGSAVASSRPLAALPETLTINGRRGEDQVYQCFHSLSPRSRKISNKGKAIHARAGVSRWSLTAILVRRFASRVHEIPQNHRDRNPRIRLSRRPQRQVAMVEVETRHKPVPQKQALPDSIRLFPAYLGLSRGTSLESARCGWNPPCP